jgi:hypothetical protein
VFLTPKSDTRVIRCPHTATRGPRRDERGGRRSGDERHSRSEAVAAIAVSDRMESASRARRAQLASSPPEADERRGQPTSRTGDLLASRFDPRPRGVPPVDSEGKRGADAPLLTRLGRFHPARAGRPATPNPQSVPVRALAGLSSGAHRGRRSSNAMRVAPSM